MAEDAQRHRLKAATSPRSRPSSRPPPPTSSSVEPSLHNPTFVASTGLSSQPQVMAPASSPSPSSSSAAGQGTHEPFDGSYHGHEGHESPSGTQPVQQQQQQQLMFVNSNNPTEFRSRSNRRIVKQWASTTGQQNLKRAANSRAQSSGEASAQRPQQLLQGKGSGQHEGTTRRGVRAQPEPVVESRQLASASRKRQHSLSATSSSSSHDGTAPDAHESGSRSATTDKGKQPLRKRRTAREQPSTAADETSSALLLPPPIETTLVPTTSQVPGSHSGSSTRTSGSRTQESPLNVLTSLSNDPFDALPLEMTEYTRELFRLYVNASLLSTEWARAEEEVGKDLKSVLIASRRNIWFPLIHNSKAAANALVAFIESTPGYGADPIQKRHTVGRYMDVALRAATDEISDPISITSDSTVFSVILLMITAQRMNDVPAFQTHKRSLLLLANRRRQTPTRSHAALAAAQQYWGQSAVAGQVLQPQWPTHVSPHGSSSRPSQSPTELSPLSAPMPRLGPPTAVTGPVPGAARHSASVSATGISYAHQDPARTPPAGLADVGFRIVVESSMQDSSSILGPIWEQCHILNEVGSVTGPDALAAAAMVHHLFLENVFPRQPFSAPEIAWMWTTRLCFYATEYVRLPLYLRDFHSEASSSAGSRSAAPQRRSARPSADRDEAASVGSSPEGAVAALPGFSLGPDPYSALCASLSPPGTVAVSMPPPSWSSSPDMYRGPMTQDPHGHHGDEHEHEQ